MVEAAERVLEYTAGMSFEQFVTDRRTYDAVLRNFMVLGEAARNIPAEIRQKYPDLSWPQLIGFRNVLIHAYSVLDDDIIWEVVQIEMSSLLSQVREILRLEDGSETG